MSASTAIIGIGNILFSDDGIGIYAARFLEENYTFSAAVDIIDGGTLGFRLLDYFENYERVLLIDTISTDDTPGTVYHLPSHALLDMGNLKQTAHEVEVIEMIKMGCLLDNMAQVMVVGITPQEINNVAFEISPPLHRAFATLTQTVLLQLLQWGITAHPNEPVKMIETIIQDYKNGSLAGCS